MKRTKFYLSLLCLFSISAQGYAQTAVTRIFTNYQGFWTSNTTTVNTIQPDSNHLLLAFTYGGITFSTGVNNALLTSNAVNFTPAIFNSFILSNNSISPDDNTVIGVGNLYGGSGNVNPLPVTNNLSQYLSDGINGLELGTALFNIPSSRMNYGVSSFNLNSLGDNVPDLVVTQVGQPPASTSLDTFRFENSAGVTVGNPVAVSLSGISVVGNGNWKFYDPGNPPVYNAGLQGSRPLRMIGFDLADFGLTSGNIGSVVRFVHKLSGNSDQAFLAYNTASFTASTGVVLPVTITDFIARRSGSSVRLSWNAADANRFSHFEVERKGSADKNFIGIASIPYHSQAQLYTYEDKNPATGLNFYRLKMVDIDGTATFSTTQLVQFASGQGPDIYPNPATNIAYMEYDGAIADVAVYDCIGKKVSANINRSGGKLILNLGALPSGTYTVSIKTEAGWINKTIVKH
jgi:hypothetical protein